MFSSASANDFMVSLFSSPLDQAQLDDFRRRLGERSPTPEDATIFSVLSMKIMERLTKEDFDSYKASIIVSKDSTYSTKERTMGAELIPLIEAKILSTDPTLREKIIRKKQKSGLVTSDKQRVRTVDTPPRFGYVDVSGGVKDWTITTNSETLVTILFDDGTKERVATTTLKSVCSAAGCQNDGKLLCSRCRCSIYCTKDCQKRHWRTHKATCTAGDAAESST
jgi:MYND finger